MAVDGDEGTANAGVVAAVIVVSACSSSLEGGAAESICCACASTPGVETDEGEDATNSDTAATASTMVVAFSSMEEGSSQSPGARATVCYHSGVQGSLPLRSSRNNANSS
jgi:hypothetical protein